MAGTSFFQTNPSDPLVVAAEDARDYSNQAKDWATKKDGPVEGNEYSAQYWAEVAQNASGTVALDITAAQEAATQAEASEAAASGFRDDSQGYRNESEGFRNETEAFRDEAESYHDELVGFSGSYSANNRMRSFATLDDLLAVNNLKAGDFVKVESRASEGDGGDNVYRVVASATGTDDGGSYINHASSSVQLQGVFPGGKVVSSQFGILGDGSDESSKFSKMMTFAGVLKLPVFILPGVFTAQFSIPSGVHVQGAGSSLYENSTADSATVIRPPIGAGYAIAMNGQGSSLSNLDVDGNGGRLAGRNGIASTGGQDCSISNVKVIDCNYGFSGDGGTPPGTFLIRDCVFRACNQGLRQLRDSSVIGCTFSANYQRGIYLNQGQVQVVDSFIEWNRDQDDISGGLPGSAEGIYLDGNASEIIISGNAFDRNAGNDVFIGDGAQRVMLCDNQYKGCGWGHDLSDAQRISVRINGTADVIAIQGGLVECRNHGPSSNKGPYTPLGFADLGSSTRVNLGSVNMADVGNPLDLNSKDFAWTESAVSGEYYLTLGSEAAIVSPVIQPAFLAHEYSQLSGGTVGSLSDQQWGWGDNDSLGFDTIYVRLTSGAPSLSQVSAFYSLPVIDDESAVNIESLASRDKATLRVGAGSSASVKLKTRERLTATNSRRHFQLVLSGDQQTSTADVFVSLPFLLKRGSGAEVSVVEGDIQVLQDGGAGFSAGWQSAGTDTIRVSVQAGLFGEELEVTLQNTDGSRFGDLHVELAW